MTKLLSIENQIEREEMIIVLAELLTKIGKDSGVAQIQRDHLVDASRSLRRAVTVANKTVVV